jgi:ribonuclease P protein component
MNTPRTTFPRAARVRKKHEFEQVFNDSRRAADARISVHWRAGGTRARLGLAVSRRVDGRAVARNRIKRCLREHFRRMTLLPGDCVVVARSAAAQASHVELGASLAKLLGTLGALPVPTTPGTMPSSAPADGATASPPGLPAEPTPSP